jgi:hypothetical protein
MPQNSVDLNMSRVNEHGGPNVLTQDQHDDHKSTCSDLIDCANKDGKFLKWIITGDEILCLLHNPQIKKQVATWKSLSEPRKKKQQQQRLNGKVMLELFTWNSFQKERL